MEFEEQINQQNEMLNTIAEYNKQQYVDGTQRTYESIEMINSKLTDDPDQTLGMAFMDASIQQAQMIKDSVVGSVQELGGSLQEGFGELLGVFGGQPLLDSLISFGGWLVSGISSLLSFTGLGSTIANALTSTTFMSTLTFIGSTIATLVAVPALLNTLMDWFTGGGATEAFNQSLKNNPVLRSINNWVKDIPLIGGLLQEALSGINILAMGIRGLGKTISSALDPILSPLFDMLIGSVDLVTDTLHLGWDLLTNPLDTIPKLPSRIAGLVTKGIHGVLDPAVNMLLGLPRLITNSIGDVFSMMGFKNIASTFSTMTNAMTNLPSKIWKKMQQLPSKMASAFNSVGNKIISSIKGLPSSIWSFMKRIPQQIAEYIPGAADLATSAVESVPGGSTAMGVAESAGSAVSSTAEAAGNLLSSATGFAQGGVIKEPSVGFGSQTGQMFTIAEKGPERITPMGSEDTMQVNAAEQAGGIGSPQIEPAPVNVEQQQGQDLSGVESILQDILGAIQADDDSPTQLPPMIGGQNITEDNKQVEMIARGLA